MTELTIGDLRKILKQNNASWTVHERFSDHEKVPRYPLGGEKEKFVLAADVAKLDLKKILSIAPNNPFLHHRRIELGFIPEDKNLAINHKSSNMLAGKSLGDTINP